MREGKIKRAWKVGIVYSDIMSVLHTSISCTQITSELATRHSLYISSNGILSDGFPRMQGTISDWVHFVAPFVPGLGTKQASVLPTGNFVALLVLAPSTKKAPVLPTALGTEKAPVLPTAPGTEKTLVLPTAPGTKKAPVLPTSGFIGLFFPAPGIKTSLVLLTSIANDVELRQDNARQSR